MFSLYGHQRDRGDNDKIGHERFYQRPVVSNSKKYRKRLYSHRKARSVTQFDPATLAAANVGVNFNSSAAAAAEVTSSSLRKRPPLLRHTSTSLDDLCHASLNVRRPSLVNEEDDGGDGCGGDDTLDNDGSEGGVDRWMHRPMAVAVAVAATPPSGGSPLSASLDSLAKFFSGVFVSSNRRSFSGASGRKR